MSHRRRLDQVRRLCRPAGWPMLLVILLAVSCGDDGEAPPPDPGASTAADPDAGTTAGSDPAAGTTTTPAEDTSPLPGELFTWMPDAGGGWCHTFGTSDEYRVPEIVCGGVVLFDFDGDQDLDVFLVQGGPWRDLEPDRPFPGHALLRNDGDWQFTDVAREAGVFGRDGAYCLGAAAADFDNDGAPDLYVTAYEQNFLYRNRGDGTFEDVTETSQAGGEPAFSTSACWWDPDGDGLLDLYVVNYLTYSHAVNRRQTCGLDTTGIRDYCSPRMFPGAQDYLFHNQGDGRFQESALDFGLVSPAPIQNHSKGLGVVALDVDADGDVDLYVSNDSTQNLLFLNDGTGRAFQEVGLIRGCGVSGRGQPQAGMGTDTGDYDNDGDLDVFVVHLDQETNALYRNNGRGLFDDENVTAGLEAPSRGKVGFGTDFFDYDHDGDLDLIVANGHVLAHVEESRQTLTLRQQDQLIENVGGGRFRLVPSEEAGRHFLRRTVGRGLATGDLDGDGDLDVVIANRGDPPAFLRNNHVENTERPDSLLLRLVGTTSNRDAIGSRVRCETGDRVLTEEVKGASSFCSRSDLRLHFGLGEATRADRLVIRWPAGSTQELTDLEGGHEYTLVEGEDTVTRVPLRAD